MSNDSDFKTLFLTTGGKLTAIFATHWSRNLCWFLGSCRRRQARVHCAKKALKKKNPIQIEPFLLYLLALSCTVIQHQTGAATLWSTLSLIGRNCCQLQTSQSGERFHHSKRSTCPLRKTATCRYLLLKMMKWSKLTEVYWKAYVYYSISLSF